MKFRFIAWVSFCLLILWVKVFAQVIEEEDEKWRRESSIPKAVDFSKIFETEKMTREEFEIWEREREMKLMERLAQVEALEQAVDPEKYIVGPGDIFSFNIWGAMEMQLHLTVSPEGKLLVPSVGELEIDGKTLTEVQKLVLDESSPFYENSKISLTLEALRFFRVHVVGEVVYPGTYVAQAVDRISEMITQAGGVTEWAWKRRIELRHPDGSVDYFDLSSFEKEGNLKEDLFVSGGDVICVPPIGLEKNLVKVEGEIGISGTYQILPEEMLINFLRRIGALKKNTDLSKIMVIRTEKNGKKEKDQYILPFQSGNFGNNNIALESNDRIYFPSKFVYVKGAVRNAGAYPYTLNMRARDYAGMAGGDFRSGNIEGVKVYHVMTGKTEKGPDVLVGPGDVVHLNPSWNIRSESYLRIITTITSLLLAAKAVGVLGK